MGESVAFSDLFKANFTTTVLIGLGALIVGPTLVPVLSKRARPVAKSLIKTGVALYNEVVEELATKEEVAAQALNEVADQPNAVDYASAGNKPEPKPPDEEHT